MGKCDCERAINISSRDDVCGLVCNVRVRMHYARSTRCVTRASKYNISGVCV